MSYEQKLKNCTKRQCEQCGGFYATGKFYGDWWQQIFVPEKEIEVKGLCEFCNKNSIYHIKK